MLMKLKSKLARKLLSWTNGGKQSSHASTKVKRSVNQDLTPVTDEEARALLETVPWAHRFELRPGLTTPGRWDFHASAVCDSLGVPGDLSGQRAMDIGAWDGPLSFELEKRGAEVVALDIQDPQRVGFGVARRILQSRVIHVQASVYELPKLGLGLFDHIVFKGVYYHLKYPLLAFEAIAKSLKTGGHLYFEGETPLNYIEDIDGRRVEVDLASLSELRVPLCVCYPNRFKDGGNWSIPNLACVESWLRTCGMTLMSTKFWQSDAPPYGGQRLMGMAEKRPGATEEAEHFIH